MVAEESDNGAGLYFRDLPQACSLPTAESSEGQVRSASQQGQNERLPKVHSK